MSYDIYLKEPISKETIHFEEKHYLTGGTYAMGGTDKAWLNITYNYGEHYYQLLDKEKGIRFIYGMTGAESIPVLKETISLLKDDVVDDYWKPTEGNAKLALLKLLALAQMRPDGIWDGD